MEGQKLGAHYTVVEWESQAETAEGKKIQSQEQERGSRRWSKNVEMLKTVHSSEVQTSHSCPVARESW